VVENLSCVGVLVPKMDTPIVGVVRGMGRNSPIIIILEKVKFALFTHAAEHRDDVGTVDGAHDENAGTSHSAMVD
jgi:hypothetical protein